MIYWYLFLGNFLIEKSIGGTNFFSWAMFNENSIKSNLPSAADDT